MYYKRVIVQRVCLKLAIEVALSRWRDSVKGRDTVNSPSQNNEHAFDIVILWVMGAGKDHSMA